MWAKPTVLPQPGVILKVGDGFCAAKWDSFGPVCKLLGTHYTDRLYWLGLVGLIGRIGLGLQLV